MVNGSPVPLEAGWKHPSRSHLTVMTTQKDINTLLFSVHKMIVFQPQDTSCSMWLC